MAHRIADQIDQDLDDAAAFAIDRQCTGGLDRDPDVRRLRFLLEQAGRFAGKRGEVQPVALGSSPIDRMTDKRWRAAAEMSLA